MNTQELIRMLMNKRLDGNAQQYLDAVIKGDNKKGEAIANNILNEYGLTKEEALQQARRLFNR